ncbi:ARM repeat-containing protein [Sistotremastrum suecicum HHB10207 ss-3]|uniref:ARM repeat-containing protein n=1 Tax=Sistotremastrum suecicum HHB10207 ss-3 TaxID=1314776 RepID=A0A166GR33_9AGAM|nr:ARM repeat-containing protein [Sistotremastrum suecicum HHB10207 ss-3]
MSKASIQSWVNTTQLEDEDEGFVHTTTWDGSDEGWHSFVSHARAGLLDSSTKRRLDLIQNNLSPLVRGADLNKSQISDLFQLVTLTYPRYVDTSSRKAAESLVVAIALKDEGKTSKPGTSEFVLSWLNRELSRLCRDSPGGASFAPTNCYVLLNWACALYSGLVLNRDTDAFLHSAEFPLLVVSLALAIDFILSDSSRAKPTMRRSALVRVRRALRNAPNTIFQLIHTLTTSSPVVTNAALVGVAVDVTIRLKNRADLTILEAAKPLVVTFQNQVLIASKVPVPTHSSAAFHDFVKTVVSEQDLQEFYLPTIEKALLRSPEIALSTCATFFQAYTRSVRQELFKKLLAPTLSSAKSTNQKTRESSVQLFSSLMSRDNTEDILHIVIDEVLALPKTSKTASVDHRNALFTMLNHIPPTKASSDIVKVASSLLAKETNEAALLTLAQALTPHLTYLLKANIPIEKTALTEYQRNMASAKPALRRASCVLTGSAMWELDGITTDAIKVFATALFPAWEGSLKTVLAAPSSSAVSSLEAYLAIAVIYGPLSRIEDATLGKAAHQSAPSLGLNSSKSFLISERTYHKITSEEEEIWLLRSLEAVALSPDVDTSSDQVRQGLGLAFIHLAVESGNASTRRECLESLKRMCQKIPRAANQLVKSGLDAAVSREPTSSAKISNSLEDAPDRSTLRQSRLAAVLLTSAAYGEAISVSIRESMLEETLLLSHHPFIGGDSRQSWVDLAQRAQIDPRDYIARYTNQLLSFLLPKKKELPESQAQRTARFHALTTLVFINPEAVLGRLLDRISSNLDPIPLKALSQDDYDIWRTPAGTLFHDVLASKKPLAIEKGKDQDIKKWEAELRKSLANKKTAVGGALSKQDQALVDAQLAHEAKIRARVDSIKSRLHLGLDTLQAIINADATAFQPFMARVAGLLLDGPIAYGSRLIEGKAIEVYLNLAKFCAERLDLMRKFIGVATLRALSISGLQDGYELEPLEELVLRVLYRLRSEAERQAFDAATFSYFNPLLSAIIQGGGLNPSSDDSALEQVALSMDVIRFHSAEVSDVAFPRSDIMRNAIHVIARHPKLSKDASSALISIGEAVYTNASRAESDFLLQGALVDESHVRNAILNSLQPFDVTDIDWSPELWVLCHDYDPQNVSLARHIWDDNGLDLPEDFAKFLLPFLDHKVHFVRSRIAFAFAEAIEYWPHTVDTLTANLRGLYLERAKPLEVEYDEYGMVKAETVDRPDPWEARLAIAESFDALAPQWSEADILPFFQFLIAHEALGDRNPEVRRAMLQAGSSVVDSKGPAKLQALIQMFESHLLQAAPPTETADYVKEAVVILFGRLARHLESGDSRLPVIVDRLVVALKTPSEQVQVAVSDCLSSLVLLMGDASELVNRLLLELLEGARYAERRGAAYGIAGIVKGLGVSSIHKFHLLGKLQQASEDKTKFERRQGAMFAFETLASSLQRLFEPFAINMLPMLLAAFGDATPDVREATQDASRAMMAHLSGYGVKLVLPSLLSGLEEKQWRTKKGAIELLGTMAYCSPKQLSLSLPTIIPHLTGVLTDSHAQVRAAANKSLKQFGEVISNPEIQSMVPVLLKGLVDPEKIPNALTYLLKTSFMHYIDSPSLAIVVPILERGLKQRGEPKRKAAQIVGNMASLTDTKDFVPYLPRLMPLVHVVLVDPVPEARATAAKALGTLVERLGEGYFPDLVPGLLQTLKSDTSGVDRQGAAQGLSEVLSGLGMERLEGLLPDIISNSTSPRPWVREGFMSLLVYLPATFGSRFQPHLTKIVTPILRGLADIEQTVQDAAMRAGRMIIANYATRAIDLLLPELENSMFNDGWRIRQSSISLVGELLFKISGVSGKVELDDDEEEPEHGAAVTETSRRALTESLGVERRDRILSALYLVRQDAVAVVRQSSVHIWKALVHNTPRTVREILPSLINKVIELLAGTEFEQQETAARTMGELCRKFGEKILSEIMPLLQISAKSESARTREGVCLALSEIMSNTTDTQREDHEDDVVSLVRKFLVDDSTNVRATAAKTFDVLQQYMGARAIDQTIPTLLEALRQPGASSGTALQALKEVMTVRASTVFPVLIPTLIGTPITAFNMRALASLVTVAGSALSRRLTVILNTLLKALETEKDEELVTEIRASIKALLLSVNDPEGLNTLMMLLLSWTKSESTQRRAEAAACFGVFCEGTDLDFSIYRIDWVRQLISMFDDPVSEVVQSAWTAFDAFVKAIPKEEYEGLVVPLHRTIESTGAPGRTVPGFSLPKGLAPTVPVIIAGLTTGSNEQREHAAYAVGDLVKRTDVQALKPFVVPFTGPLIRVATQAATYPPAVKTAILSALLVQLELIPAFVKPFFPQLQRTFVKSAADPASSTVRTKAAQALGALMKHQPRADQICTELLGGIAANDDPIAASLILALANVVRSAHQNLNATSQESIIGLLSSAWFENHEDPFVEAFADLFSAMAPFPDLLRPLVEGHLLAGTPLSPQSSHVLAKTIENSPDLFYTLDVVPSIVKKVTASIGSEKPSISRPAREAKELLRATYPYSDDEGVQSAF